MKALTQLRKELKLIGYKVSLKSSYMGRHATYTHIESGMTLSGNVFNPSTLLFWKPLFDYIKGNGDLINAVREEEECFGLKGQDDKIMTYLEQCTRYFAPLDEIQEALNNNEGICGMTNQELLNLIESMEDLKKALNTF